MKTIIKIILLSMFFTVCSEKGSDIKITKHVTTDYAKELVLANIPWLDKHLKYK